MIPVMIGVWLFMFIAAGVNNEPKPEAKLQQQAVEFSEFKILGVLWKLK